MENEAQLFQKTIARLKERAKELNCLYKVDELLKDDEAKVEDIFNRLMQIIPSGWKHLTVCEVRIIYEDMTFTSEDFRETAWIQSANIIIDDTEVGKISVVYTQFIEEINGSQFLPEEQKLLNTIAERLSMHLFSRKLKKTIEFLKESSEKIHFMKDMNSILVREADEHWKWRLEMAQHIADRMDPTRFDVKGIYVIGSVKNATAGPASDIDIMIHVGDDLDKQELLRTWIDGWSHSLAEMNFMRTGYSSKEGIIDLHLITDEDIRNKTSYAVMIGSLYNAARPIKIFIQ
jgi:hypothetical protein